MKSAMTDDRPHQKKLRVGRHSEPYGLYYITKCVKVQTVLLPVYRYDIVRVLMDFREKHWLYLQAFVIMPDHWHLLFCIGDEKPLPILVKEICRRTSYAGKQRCGRLLIGSQVITIIRSVPARAWWILCGILRTILYARRWSKAPINGPGQVHIHGIMTSWIVLFLVMNDGPKNHDRMHNRRCRSASRCAIYRRYKNASYMWGWDKECNGVRAHLVCAMDRRYKNASYMEKMG